MGFAKLTGVWNRIYGDFFMPSKLEVYETFLAEFISHGYQICSVAFLWNRIQRGTLGAESKYLVLRHDIDTDPATARAMWEIEQRFGIQSSYYFRLSTLDVALMQRIEAAGGEASYHFEEAATVAKQRRFKTREHALRHLPYMRQLFRLNLNRLRRQTGLAMKIVAAHGDFVNRKLRLYNWEILNSPSFRRDVGVELEVYDDAFMRHVTSRHSEVVPPRLWEPSDPRAAARRGARVIQILVHPRQWYANRRENFIDDVRRAWEGVRYAL